jgi:hypothetical protein
MPVADSKSAAIIRILLDELSPLATGGRDDRRRGLDDSIRTNRSAYTEVRSSQLEMA